MATLKVFDHHIQQLAQGLHDNQVAHEDFGRSVEQAKKRRGSSQKSAERDYERASLQVAEKLNEVKAEYGEVRDILEEANIDVNDPTAMPTIANRLDMPVEVGFQRAYEESQNVLQSIDEHILELEKCWEEETNRLEDAARRRYGRITVVVIIAILGIFLIVNVLDSLP